ncbi:MAG TPA: riboflavin synthase [Casimicrobiaceae bacterium]|nr:riboflavin synthase [Casimicrobiaceae bacterium]
MFTGIVQMVGRIAAVTPRGDGVRIAVDTGVQSVEAAVGDSIAVAGCCLTVVAIEGATLCFDVSAETLRVTNGLDRIGDVNLELALRLADRLGGHLMSGHVDGVGAVREFAAVPGDANGSWRLAIEAPRDLARFIAPKGSIAVDGVSLTVNEVAASRFVVNLIPHTLAVTTLKALAPGARVNLEVDLIARYVERLFAHPASDTRTSA